MKVKQKESYILFLFQLVAHLSVIPMFMYANVSDYLLSLTVYFFTGCFGMTMIFHRYWSHKSWTPPTWFIYFGTLCGVVGLTGSPISWASVHREHHKYTDKEKDPHSPNWKGFVRCQWFSMFGEVHVRYIVDLLKNKKLVWIHKNYVLINIVYSLCLYFFLGPFFVISMHLFPAFVLWNLGSFIITLSHIIGYRNFDIDDNSRNSSFLAFIQFGEGLHNNHHARPNNWSFKYHWWEFDLGGFFIKLLNTKSMLKKN